MLERHHIVFRSQGGLDIEINYVNLSPEDHRGDNSPHRSDQIDKEYKIQMEKEVRDLLIDEYYTEEKLMDLLDIDSKTAYKAFRKVFKTSNGMVREDVVKRIMGGKFYL